MKIAILGATGMIGHRLFKDLQNDFEVMGYGRKLPSLFKDFIKVSDSNYYSQFDALNFSSFDVHLTKYKPNVILNCVGVVKQLEASKRSIPSIELNSLFPHRLALFAQSIDARVINFSSDCVFNGSKGMYVESDFTDAIDLYGKTKALGEVVDLKNVLTLRTSFIGRELFPHGGLVEWFLSQNGNTVSGYNSAIYSGLTTIRFVDILKKYIIPNKELSGLYHLSGNVINKFELLKLIQKELKTTHKINQSSDVVINRSLNSSKFRLETGFVPPTWEELISDLQIDIELYEKRVRG